MFYSRRDIIWSLFWIAILSAIAILPFHIGNGEGLDSPSIKSSVRP